MTVRPFAHDETAGRTKPQRAAGGSLTRVATLRDLSRAAGEVFVGLALLFSPALAADEDKDLDLIPPAAQQSAPSVPAAAPATTGNGTQRNYLEDAFSATPLRDSLAVPFPPPAPASWEDRLFLDSRDEWHIGDDVTLTYSGRFNPRAANDIPFPSHENVLNELREAFVSWQAADGTWIDLGRVNLKSGVAEGFNPTDFFRTRAVVEPLTADPTVLREDRLGTLMLLAQRVWTDGSITAAYAPKVTQPTAIYTNIDLPSFDPMLDRTNAEHRFLLKGSMTIANGFSPELLLYHAGDRTQVGGNLTAGLGQQTIGYVEWAGGVGGSLIDDALRYGRETGTLPAQAPAVIPDDPTQRFRNDLAVGLSYTPTDTRLTFNLEYHYAGDAFSAQDWRNWFNAAARHGNIPGVDAALWYIRSYAQDQQEPMSQHSAFLRADWVDAFVPDLELTALANVDLEDGSGLVQATADYYLSRTWTVGGLASFTFGTRRSELGSLPQAGSVLLRLVRYL
jgi:hypothetical protein